MNNMIKGSRKHFDITVRNHQGNLLYKTVALTTKECQYISDTERRHGANVEVIPATSGCHIPFSKYYFPANLR